MARTHPKRMTRLAVDLDVAAVAVTEQLAVRLGEGRVEHHAQFDEHQVDLARSDGRLVEVDEPGPSASSSSTLPRCGSPWAVTRVVGRRVRLSCRATAARWRSRGRAASIFW